MLNLVYFLVFFFKKYFLLYLWFLCPQIYHLMKNNSSSEAANIACDFVVFAMVAKAFVKSRYVQKLPKY